MTVYTAVILAILVCLAQCRPQEETSPEGRWRKIYSAARNTVVKDGYDKIVMFANGNLTVCGDFNRDTDQDVVTNFVADKLSLFEHYPEELQEVYVEHSPLPLLFNMSVKELITLGPRQVKHIGVLLDVKVYAKKRRHQEAISALKSLGSTF